MTKKKRKFCAEFSENEHVFVQLGKRKVLLYLSKVHVQMFYLKKWDKRSTVERR